jgi:putative CocE/NonD family hydrolase
MRARTVGFVVALLAMVIAPIARADSPPSPYPGGGWSPEQPTYGAAVDPVVMVPMDDGVKIRVQVVYPTDPATGVRARGPFPVLITQSPYSTNLGVAGNVPACQDAVTDTLTNLPGELSAGSELGPCPGSYYVERGYIVIQSDQRGTGLSEGDHWGLFGPRDAKDGAELAQWAANPRTVPGSNGRVGLFGCSALGISQLVTAAELGREYGANQPVKAMVPGCITGGMYRDTAFDNGIPAPIAGLLGAQAGLDATRQPIDTAIFQRLSKSFGPNIFSGGDMAYERQFWGDRKVADQAGDIVKSGMRVLTYVGWQEGGFIGGLDLYTQLQNAWAGRDRFAPMSAGQKVTGRYQLFIANGPHGCCMADPGVQLQFFDHWLKDDNTGVDDTTRTPMHIQELGTGRYVNVSAYPFTGDSSPYYLGAGTMTATAQPGGTDQLVWGPPSNGGTSRSYVSDPLARGATIAGPMSLAVYASSSNTNLQLLATLSDVAPDGTVTEVTHGSLLGSLSELDKSRSWTSRQGAVMRPYPLFQKDIYKPAGQVVAYDLALQPKLYAVAPGHRIQITLATQASPQACAAVATLGPPLGCLLTTPQQRTLAGGVYQIQRGGRYPTVLNLPLLPYGVYPTTPSNVTPTSGGQLVPHNWG